MSTHARSFGNGDSCVRSMIGETYGNALTGYCIDLSDDSDVKLTVGALVYDGLSDVARSLGAIADAIHRLGNNNASTELGAIENLSMQVERVADAISQERNIDG